MDQAGLLAHLLSLTGDLESGDAGPDELHNLRRRLAASLRSVEQDPPPEPAIVSKDTCLHTQLRLAVVESEEEVVPEGSRLTLVRRDSPLLLFAGQAPTHIFGPFLDAIGRPIWFDEFLVGPTLQVLWAGQPDVKLVLPAARVLPGAQNLQFGAGSIWVLSRALAAGAPAAAYSGWKVQRASLELSAAGALNGNKLTLPANATCRLTMVPDDTESAASPPNGPGVDAAAAEIKRPAEAELSFSAGGLSDLRSQPAVVQFFGNRIDLERIQAPPSYDATIERVVVPFAANPNALAALTSQSTLCTLAGKGNITGAGWAPITSKTSADLLGDPGSGGMFVVIATGSFAASGGGINRGPVRLGASYFLIDRGLVGVLSPLAQNRTASYSVSLWQRAALRLAFDEPFIFLYLSSRVANEVLQYRGTLTASLDRPKQADGRPLPVQFPKATVTLFQTAAGLSTIGAVSNPDAAGRTALALSNGLFTVTPVRGFSWNIALATANAAASGTLQLRFGVFQLLPALPDPYAANFGSEIRADAPRGLLDLNISWVGADPQFAFTIVAGNRGDGSPEILPAPQFAQLKDQNAENLRKGFYSFVHNLGLLGIREDPLVNLRLLDVSTNADQLGVDVAYTPESIRPVEVAGVDLVSLGGPVDVLMLPQVQWEPVRVEQNPDVGFVPSPLASPDDGGPTLVGAQTVRLTPIAPMALTPAVIEAHNQKSERTGAFFTLPFGIRAIATLNPARTHPSERASIRLFQEAFVNSFTSATQVRLTAAPPRLKIPPNALLPIPVLDPPLLPGAAIQLIQASDQFHTKIVYAGPPPAEKNPPISVLDPIDQDFNRTFGPDGLTPRVPIERVDLSGYGESCFSDWADEAKQIGITNVKFEVLVGRTRYEVIRMRSLLVPCQAVLVRTITIERRASGTVFRRDSGWQAVTPGLFDSPDPTVKCHSGAVRGFYNIRHIRDSPGTIPIAGAEVQVVHFDADVKFDNVIAGANSEKLVPALNQLGFVQRIPLKVKPAVDLSGAPLPGVPPIVETEVKPLNPAQMQALLERFDPVGGPLDCMIDIGGSGQQMRLTGAFCTPAPKDGGTTEFAVASYGSLMVPRNEPWSVVRTASSTGDVAAVDIHRGVPLVRMGGTPLNPPSGNYRIADPQDLLRNPAVDYGILLTTGTHRLLFRRPEIPTPGTQIRGTLPPVLADPYALVGSGGAFPKLDTCLHLNAAPYNLDITPGGFRWNTPAGGVTFSIPALGGDLKRFLIKSGAFDMRADYKDRLVEIAANQITPWAITIPKVPAVLDIKTPDFGDDILKVVNDLFTPGTAGLVPNGPEIVFGGILDTAKDVITALQTFLPDTPPIQIDLSPPRLDDPTMRLLIAARFPIAKPDGSAIDIGIGKFRGEIGVGTEIRLTLSKFGGRIFFNVKGELQQPLLPKIVYVGGSLFLEISIDESGKPAVRLITSAVASVGGDLIPGIIELEGSVSYGYFLDTNADPFLPGVALGMEIRAKLLSGLIGVRFRADLAVGIIPIPANVALFDDHDLLIRGQFTAHGSVVALWAFEEDFEKTLNFEQKVPGLVAGAFAIYTGMLPIPI